MPQEIVILDGAMGSELERRGCDTSLPLWSARALIEHPHLVEAIHREHLSAGATAITANTFRTHARSLANGGLGKRAIDLTRFAVELAQRARDAEKPDALVLGSVAPLEDCYEPSLAPPASQCAAEHGAMIDALAAAGVDLILIETMNNATEAGAAAEAAAARMPGRYVVSCCCAPIEGDASEPAILSGEPLLPLLRSLEAPFAVGVNCVAAPAIEPIVAAIRVGVESRPQPPRIIAYGNIGAPDAARGWVNTDAVEPQRYADYAAAWVAAGASIVGGCCGTTPQTIRAVVNRLM